MWSTPLSIFIGLSARGLPSHLNIHTWCGQSYILYFWIFVDLSARAIQHQSIFSILLDKHYLQLAQYSLVCLAVVYCPILVFTPNLVDLMISVTEYLLRHLPEQSNVSQYPVSFCLSMPSVPSNIHWCVHPWPTASCGYLYPICIIQWYLCLNIHWSIQWSGLMHVNIQQIST